MTTMIHINVRLLIDENNIFHTLVLMTELLSLSKKLHHDEYSTEIAYHENKMLLFLSNTLILIATRQKNFSLKSITLKNQVIG
jgi:hypothetical protein